VKPTLELIATGNELLNGSVLNRHAQWLGSALGGIGWSLARESSIPDDESAILDAIRNAFTRVEVVILTGGLGPTSDDLSRDAAAKWAGRGIEMHQPSRQRVIEIYASRNKPLNNLVENHALVVEGAAVLDNREGLAPGEYLQQGNRHLFLLPGPPREFHAVMNDHVLPRLRQFGIGDAGRHHTFQILGLGESDVAARLDAQGLGRLGLDIAYCANPSQLFIRLHERAGHAMDYDRAVSIVRAALSDDLFSEDERPPALTILGLLNAHHMTLATAESCTGGLLGSMITAIPGSSATFLGGVIAYHNKIKVAAIDVADELILKHGAVSDEVARAMAGGVRARFGADVGVAITGVAGPGGGTKDKPVGLVHVAVSDRSRLLTQALRFGGDRAMIREASCMCALDLVRRLLRPL